MTIGNYFTPMMVWYFFVWKELVCL